MRDVMKWSKNLMGLIKDVKSLGGFAKQTATDVKSGNSLKSRSGSLMNVAGDTAEYLSLAAEVQDESAWFSKAWVAAKVLLLDTVSSKVLEEVYFFEKSVRTLRDCEKVIGPLGQTSKWNRAAHITMHGFELVRKFNDLGAEYKRVKNRVDHKSRPMAEESEKVSMSFFRDAKAFEPGKIDKSKCEWKIIMFLDSKLKEDSGTMKCLNLSFTGKKMCWCKVPWRDCYVKKENHEPPSELEECFIKGK
eukprot:TRINITY_DN14825_c0_g1_i1.p1 TRINITY_DN14825_c0_g1~~TRINITY_DN14825_c0_g1_i1.p1  ORF type:complete len:247 (-),score=42.36 TRINITY_DN14825_c0_g1_i1:85-825(-)